MWETLKNTFQYRMMIKYDLIQENDKEIKFYFETHERKVVIL